jgi:hypothetical protein
MLKFFRIPFANSGDKTAVPDALDPSGNVSYTQGYGPDYQRPKTDPLSKDIERDKMNNVLFDVTAAISELQSQGLPDWIDSTLNGGTPNSYAINALVRYNGQNYRSLQNANTFIPTDAARWQVFNFSGADYVLKAGDTMTGNLGIGVTPSVWSADMKVLQFGVGSALSGRTPGHGTYLSDNVRFSGDPVNNAANGNYIYSSAAAAYQVAAGGHSWFTAPSGTAGDAISFTQAMTLNESGYLTLIGDPITALGAATKQYVDAASAGAAPQLRTVTATVASNAITVTLAPNTIVFRSTTANNGAVTSVSNAANVTLTIASTDSFGAVTAGGNQRLAILAINNAGTIELAASNLAGGVNLDETGVITTATTATTATAIKAANVRSNVAYRVVGFIDVPFTTGTGWGALVRVQGAGGQAMAALSSLGYGQTWQDVTGSRVGGTTYYNTTGKPIFVTVRANLSNPNITLTVSGLNMGTIFTGTNNLGSVSACVPPGAPYVVTVSAGSIAAWNELR